MEDKEIPSDPGTAFQLGTISGQLREVIHTSNNMSGKIDGLAHRIGLLEKAENRREGMSSVFHAIWKSPFVAWLFAAAAAVIAFARGKIEI